MGHTAVITIENYGEVKVDLPPKNIRKNKGVLVELVAMAVNETYSLIMEKTVNDFASSIEESTPNHICKKHSFQLDSSKNQSWLPVIFWRCKKCFDVLAVSKDWYYNVSPYLSYREADS